MKSKLILFVLILSFILSGCSGSNNSASKNDTLASNGKAADNSEVPTSAVIPSVTITEKPTVTAAGLNSSVHTYLDYSDHKASDEELYKTVLADPTKLTEGKPILALKESTADWSFIKFNGFKRQDIWGYDVRSCDISKADLNEIDDLNYVSFNSDTVWPKKLPNGFDPERILEYNKNPGLGIRDLHGQGITGKNIGIAIIDQPLLLEHEQYKDNVMYYERIHCDGDEASLHGPAVASIAVGKTIGVAPDAKLYYIAATPGHYASNKFDYDFSIMADCILRVLDINKNLPENEKIRVISISLGYDDKANGYAELKSAIEKANSENIFVLTTATNIYYNFSLFGMDRNYMEDPDDFNSYIPAAWIAEDFYRRPGSFQNDILVPMGSRTYASCTGTENYEIGHEGGLSWAVPWCAGFYSLCCQVKPEITPQEFIDVIESTAVTTDIKHDGKNYKFGKIINPAEAIKKLKQ